MRNAALAGLLALTAPAAVSCPQPASASARVPQEAQIAQIETAFFDNMKAGKVEQAIEVSIGASPLMAGRTAEKAGLIAQFSSGIEAYGPIRQVEQISETRLGTMLVRRIYMAQHETMLTRWRIDFVRLPSGWTASYMFFNDTVKDWE